MKFQGTYGTDFKGSLGGTTASRNKGGQYLKSKPIPTNPKTLAQVASRARFNAAASGFSALSPTEVALWNQYAQTRYLPRKSSNTGQFTGFQAYTSLNNQTFNALDVTRAMILQVDNVDPTTPNTTNPWAPPSNAPPTVDVVPQIIDKAGNQQSLSPVAAIVKSDGNFEFEFQVGDGVAKEITKFAFPDGSNAGFVFFLSNGNLVQGRSFQNVERYLLGYCQSVSLGDVADYASFSTLKVKSINPLDISIFNTWPQTGNTCIITMYLIGEAGNMTKIGVKEVQMQAA